MLRKLFPILLALVGLGGGVGAGLALRPARFMFALSQRGLETGPL